MVNPASRSILIIKICIGIAKKLTKAQKIHSKPVVKIYTTAM
jgi:hypothetical protein